MSRVIHCKGCAYLVVIKRGRAVTVRCLATVKFVDSPLRRRVDVTGLRQAMLRNKHKNCTFKRIFSIKAMVIKSWLMKNLGGKDAIKFVGLKEVSTDKEKTDSSEKKGRQQKAISEEKTSAIEESSEKEVSKETSEEKAESETKTKVKS